MDAVRSVLILQENTRADVLQVSSCLEKMGQMPFVKILVSAISFHS